MVEVSVGRVREAEGSKADVVQSLVVHAKGFRRVFHQVVHG